MVDGSRTDALAAAEAACTGASLWISDERGQPVSSIRRLLGQGFDTVVLDLAQGFNADVLGIAHGLVRGGGRLILVRGRWEPGWDGVVVWPHLEGGRRMAQRLELPFPEGEAVVADPLGDQAALILQLREAWSGPPGAVVITADRGRGKSAALGLALEDREAVITGPSQASAAEVFRFARSGRWVPPSEVRRAALVVVDEAAALPVPVLEALVNDNPGAHLVFASTVHGYEGTGRGFSVRFLPALRRRMPVTEARLEHPIRWGPGDPLERWVFDVLALDAEPHEPGEGPVVCRRVPPDELARDEGLLRGVFGLLVQAHYRTTPSDLQRMLDAPNLAVHVAQQGAQVVGASLVAGEGGLDDAMLERMLRGERLRGHALPDTLVSHLGCTLAARMHIARSVRIAVHPDRRRLGIASALVQHVHDDHTAELFGTMFAASPDVLEFRRSLGYRLVRVGSVRGARSGEPAAVMLRGTTPAAKALIAGLQADLARELPVMLGALGGRPLDPALRAALEHDLPEPAPWTDDALAERLQGFARGRPFESVAPALLELDARGALDLDAQTRAWMHGLATGTLQWKDLPAWSSVPAAMRGLRSRILDAHG